MIKTSYFVLGFIVYIFYTMITFNVYAKKEGLVKFFIFFIIYIFYTILAGYVISFVDSNATFMEKLIEILVYSIVGGIFMLYHYESSIKKPSENYLEQEPDDF